MLWDRGENNGYAQHIADDLASIGFGKRIGAGRSLGNWWKWMRHKELPK